jgi:hypothetical protein
LSIIGAAILEARAGAGDQVLDGAGRQDLRCSGERHDPRADVHGNAAELAVDLLTFAGVHSGSHVDTEALNGHDDRGSTRERASRLRERGEEPVAGGVLLAAPVAPELLADDSAEPRQQLPPTGIAELRSQGSRADDVEEQNGRQPAPHSVPWHGSIIRQTAGRA